MTNIKILYYSSNSFPPIHFGGEAILRYYNEVPFFRVASNVNSRYFYNI